jgi:hypothetical protein
LELAVRVKLVTTWDMPCGISEHSYYLVKAVQAADPSIIHDPVTDLHPRAVLNDPASFDLLVLNYHAGLLSQWQPPHIQAMQQRGTPVLCILHDTGVPNSDQAKAIAAAADATIVHEPASDLPGTIYYWRMGVPGPQLPRAEAVAPMRVAAARHRCLGTIGFPFPWKHYDQLARLTAELGWALLLIAPGASAAQIAEWQHLNPLTVVRPDFVPRDEAIGLLSACDATAFAYICHNTGQSAAILQGIAARRPVFAFHTCRQFRALFHDSLGRTAITWSETFEELGAQLARGGPSMIVSALAEQESWTGVGRRYADLYRGLAR